MRGEMQDGPCGNPQFLKTLFAAKDYFEILDWDHYFCSYVQLFCCRWSLWMLTNIDTSTGVKQKTISGFLHIVRRYVSSSHCDLSCCCAISGCQLCERNGFYYTGRRGAAGSVQQNCILPGPFVLLHSASVKHQATDLPYQKLWTLSLRSQRWRSVRGGGGPVDNWRLPEHKLGLALIGTKPRISWERVAEESNAEQEMEVVDVTPCVCGWGWSDVVYVPARCFCMTMKCTNHGGGLFPFLSS
jgi:hypothetical protein